MRIMLIGSIPNHAYGTNQQVLPEHQSLLDAAQGIGYAVAKAGHRILVGSTSPRTIDFYVIEGAADFCRQYPGHEIYVEVHRPESEPARISAELGNLKNLRFFPYLHHADPSSPHKWVVAHARAVDEADVVIAICGSTSTRVVGHLAADRRKPLIAIPCFNGAAGELFSLLRYTYNEIIVGDIPAITLLSEWNNNSPRNIVKLAEELVASKEQNSHTYFISYSWDDCQVADHVEVLLRRNHRLVNRDVNIETDQKLSSAIQGLIEESDSFIAIWSSKAAESSWCPKELEFARQLKENAGGRLKRIVFLAIDNENVPMLFTDFLRRAAATRSERELAVLRIIQSEI